MKRSDATVDLLVKATAGVITLGIFGLQYLVYTKIGKYSKVIGIAGVVATERVCEIVMKKILDKSKSN